MTRRKEGVNVHASFARSLQDILRKGGLPNNHNGRSVWIKVKHVLLDLLSHWGSDVIRKELGQV